MIGKTVGDYRITDLLGEGGMGMVYRAVHSVVGQVVAIKALHPTLIANEGVRRRFEREAQALARFNHSNIVRLLNYVTTADGCYIIMEFTEGETIEDKLARDAKVKIDKCLDWFVQTLDALEFAHDQAVIHRDIKPSNIMIGRDGKVKLLDFGTAKLVDAQGLTRQGMTLGTVIYMSPEQILGRELDHRSDIYSVGVTLYETATGQLPFYDDAEHELVKQIVKQDPIPPSQHDPAIPSWVENAILRSLAKKPKDRFASAREMRDALVVPGSRGLPGSEVLKKRTPQEVASPEFEKPKTSDTVRVLAVSSATDNEPDGPSAPQPPPTRKGSLSTVLLVAGVLAIAGGIAAGLPLLATGKVVVGGVVLAALSGAGVFLAVLGLLERRSAPRLPPPVEEPMMLETARGKLPISTEKAAAVPPEARQVPDGARGVLYVLAGTEAGQSVALDGEDITIGRAPDNTLVLTDPGVSAMHCTVRCADSGFVIEDAGSRNGTYLNNARVERTELADGDLLILGSSRVHVSLK